MGSKLRQVLRMYINTRWQSWMLAVFWLVMLGEMILMCGPASYWPSKWRVQLLEIGVRALVMPTFWLGLAVASLLKLQFANPRARLLPGFAAPHLIVAGATIAAAVAGSTWAIVWTSAAPGPAVAALVVVEMTAAVCLAYLGCAGVFVLWLILVVITLGDGGRFVAALILEDNPVITVTGLCVGLALLAAVACVSRCYARKCPITPGTRPARNGRPGASASDRAGDGRWPGGAFSGGSATRSSAWCSDTFLPGRRCVACCSDNSTTDSMPGSSCRGSSRWFWSSLPFSLQSRPVSAATPSVVSRCLLRRSSRSSSRCRR